MLLSIRLSASCRVPAPMAAALLSSSLTGRSLVVNCGHCSRLRSIVRQSDDSTNHYDQLKWGLVPSWSTDPSILQPDAYGLWLDRKLQDPQHLEHLYKPFPEELMTYYEVPTLVNNPRFDSSACIVHV
ncbi:MAG: SOS response-associated peptidase family protein [Desulfuromonadaceae bacterium]